MSLYNTWESWANSRSRAKRFVAGFSFALWLMTWFALIGGILLGIVWLGILILTKYDALGIILYIITLIPVIFGLIVAIERPDSNRSAHPGPR